MGCELLHIMEFPSVQWLPVNDVIPILSPAVHAVVLVGVVLRDSLGGTMMDYEHHVLLLQSDNYYYVCI